MSRYSPDRTVLLIPVGTDILTAQTIVGDAVTVPVGAISLTSMAKFVYGSGGTSVSVYLQTTFDDGVTWCDVQCHKFLLASATKISSSKNNLVLSPSYSPTDGSLTANSSVDGLMGDRIRAKVVVVGTYVASTIHVGIVIN